MGLGEPLAETFTGQTYTIDNTPPTTPTVNTLVTNSTNPTVTGTFDAASGSIFVEVSINGGLSFNTANQTTSDWDFTFSGVSEGTYDVIARTADAAGNQVSDVTSNELTVDTTDPNITSGSNTPTVEEATTFVETYGADETVTWSLSGDDASLFDINTSGDLTFLAAPDFENPGDLGADNNYKVTVTAQDEAGNTQDLSVSVTVTDLDEIAPNITTGSATPTIAENTTAVETYTADEAVTWSITAGDDGLLFQINSSGELAFNTAPDFEAPGDVGTDNMYEVTITATDAALNASDLMVTVSVDDVDEAAPVFETSTPTASNETISGFDINYDLDELGNVYYVVVADGDGAPTAAEVRTGTGSGGTGQLAAASASYTDAANIESQTVSGLDINTAYDVYVVAEDAAGNLQTIATLVEVTTLCDDPAIATGAVVITEESLATGNDGAIDATGQVSGGSGDYVYQWYIGSTTSTLIGSDSPILSSLAAGDYSLQVTDATTGCVSTLETFTVTLEVAANVVLSDANVLNDNSVAVTDGFIVPGGDDDPVYRFNLRTDKDVTVTGLSIPFTGTLDASEIVTAELRINTDESSVTQPHGVATATGVISTGSIDFTFSETINGPNLNADTLAQFWVSLDLSASATVGATFRATTETSDLVFSGSPSIIGSITDGGLFTVDPYCDPRDGFTIDRIISGVTLESIDQASVSDYSTEYTYYSSTDASLTQAESYTLLVDTDGGTGLLDVYIDWNLDGDFADTDEQVTVKQAVAANEQDINVAISVPMGATPGDARMRIIIHNSTFLTDPQNGCSNGGSFEIEDYPITVVAGDFTAPAPVITSVSGSPTNVNPFSVQVDFGEVVSTFSAIEVTPTNGALSNFVDVDGQVYTFDITPLFDETTVNIAIAAAVVTDAAGNDNTAADIDIEYDAVAPNVTINSLTTSDQTPELTGTIDDATASIEVTIDAEGFTATNNGDGTWTLADNTITTDLSEGTYDIEVVATDAAGNEGQDGTTDELIIDGVPPSVGVDELITSDDTPELTGSVDDISATVEVTVNGTSYPATNNGDGTWTLADNTISSLAEGTYDVEVKGTDEGGNEGTDSTTDELIVDTTAPVVTVDALTTGDTTPELSGTIDDADASVSVTVDGTAYEANNNGDGTWTLFDDNIAALAEGTYDVSVSSFDLADNEGTDATSNELVVDLTAPTLLVDVQTTNATSPAITGTIDDTDATIVLTINGEDYNATNNGDGTWSLAANSITDLTDGNYDVLAVATDNAGNVGSDNSISALTIDTVAPVVTVVSQITNITSPELTGSVDDPSATVEVEVDGITYTPAIADDGAWTIAAGDIAALAEGTYEVEASATDAAGNVGEDATTTELEIDLTAPVITVTGLTTADLTPELDGTIDDASATIAVEVDGQVYAATNNGDGTWKLPDNTIADLTTGTYEVEVTATDVAGNAGTDGTTNELVIDDISPVVTVNSLTTNDVSPELTGSIDDAVATVVVTVSGVDYPATNNGDGTWTLASGIIADLAEGTYDVVVVATDGVGNAGTDATSDELDIDTTPPTVTVDALTTGDISPELTGAIDDADASISVTVDGSSYTATNNGDGTWTLANTTIADLIEGIYDVAVLATDVAGNTGADATTDELEVDTTPPTVTVNALTTGDTTPELTGTIDDVDASVSITVNGNNYPANNNGDGTWTLADDVVDPLPQGIYDVAVSALDAVNNEGLDATTDELTIDVTIPVVGVNELTTNVVSPEVTGTIDDALSSVTVTIDNVDYAATNNGDGTWTIAAGTLADLADGSYDVLAIATDPANNSGSDNAINALIIDTVVPVVTVTPLNTNENSPALSGTVDDPSASVSLKVNEIDYNAVVAADGTWSISSGTIATLPDGTYDLEVTGTDAAGNNGSDNTTDELRVDATAPQVTVEPLTTSIVSPELTGSYTEANAVVSIVVRVADVDYSGIDNADGTWTLPAGTVADLTTGTYDVSVTITDDFGNTGTDVTDNELVIDQDDAVPPVVTVDVVESFDRSPELTGTIDDADASVEITVEGVGYPATNNGDGTWTLVASTFPLLDVGTYSILATATNLSNLTATDDSENELKILPAVTMAQPAINITTGSFTATWDAQAGGVATYLLDVSQQPDFSLFWTVYQDFDTQGSTTATISSLDYNASFYYRVRVSYNSGDVSDYSNVVTVTTATDPGTALDSAALVAIYDATGGENWKENNNWKTGRLRSWDGIEMNATRVISVDLGGNNLVGRIARINEGLEEVTRFDVSDNELTNLGRLSSLSSLEDLDVSGNRLQFADIERIVNAASAVNYAPQNEVLDEIRVLEEVGASYTVDRLVTGSSNTYRWFLVDENTGDETEIGEFSDVTIGGAGSFELTDITETDEGIFFARVTNGSAPDLTLVTKRLILRVSSLERDQRALLAVYNATGGATWGLENDWVGNVTDGWTGVALNGDNTRVVGLTLTNVGMTGEVPDDITDIAGLTIVNLTNNDLSDIPDMSTMPNLATLNVDGNRLDFLDLEPNISISSFTYGNQQPFALQDLPVNIPRGSNYTIDLDIVGTANNYQWSLDVRGEGTVSNIDGATGSTYEIQNINYNRMGDYRVSVTSDVVPLLTLTSEPQTINATANLDFNATYFDVDGNELTLPDGLGFLMAVVEGDRYDSLLENPASVAGGASRFEEVILGNYVLGVTAESLADDLLPTYYSSAFLWEGASTIELRNNFQDVMVMVNRPVDLPPVPGNDGVVALEVESDFADDVGKEGEKVEARRRVRRAGCSLRRRRRAGGGRLNNDEEFELVAYKETDDNGQVTFENLPDGTYRLNIEYPGIPMNPNSFIEFEIGEGGIEDNELTLAAIVTEEGISVELVLATGHYRDYFKDLELYPVPANKVLNIRYEKLMSDRVKVQMVNLQGRIVLEKDVAKGFNQTMTLDVEHLETGMYLLRFYDPESGEPTIITYRVIINRDL